ncbi:NAD(P)H-dependent glycerol-3-phosphate dehydrogenase [Methylobacter sp. Wu8]|jgi:glycerol-3-phosphate dehydrogenase (NAD(P)+)|uniref:Glycerol-3-phosphate dehydrogenase [NAD(P)+] n=1 Tax=Methylobacter tundripaludum TaxID=173365 RepID=A0A2S6GFY6_9GAMM|nr:NAD(P)H-dependent glycerol-3-phosphate dehydrogenase [Methylobacter tundripaludum]MCF7967069.1 NAD(P)-dependent glycerol-3-phosphate dehydrogenase [Methylobacter tundripaludum]MCK9634825.1 NAD(P)-dependent glycerol-3-phosphate dehydrogenase [Methylobacter tundripaludum]PPK64124.1 glycerol 3-phosphate dehydrogenase (NAD(P)+) [Methylobacter tundripaludum]
MNKKIAVLGAGSWGTTLAILAARNGCRTLLWGHNREHMASLAQDRENKRYLPGPVFPENLSVTSDLAEVAGFCNLILVSVPSHAFKDTLLKLKAYLPDGIQIAWATKGFNSDNGSLLHKVVADIFSEQTPAALLSGPSFAAEVAADLPTAITIASPQPDFAALLADILHSERFRTYTNSDLIGVEVGGAVKNVMAIAAGIADGLGLGANTRAALITRGLNEIIRLGVKLGGKQETFMGLAGLGDLILTCTDNQSRNRRFGLALGQGKDRAEAIQEIGQEIEGISAAKETFLLAKKHGVDMPITEQTYKVLYEGLAPLEAVQNLLAREQKAES